MSNTRVEVYVDDLEEIRSVLRATAAKTEDLEAAMKIHFIVGTLNFYIAKVKKPEGAPE